MPVCAPWPGRRQVGEVSVGIAGAWGAAWVAAWVGQEVAAFGACVGIGVDAAFPCARRLKCGAFGLNWTRSQACCRTGRPRRTASGRLWSAVTRRGVSP